MYIYIHMFICICIYVCICVYIYAYIHVCVCVRVSVSVYIYMYTLYANYIRITLVSARMCLRCRHIPDKYAARKLIRYQQQISI